MLCKKKSISDLAIFGGKPMFKERLCVGRPNICNREALFRRLNEVTDRLWLTNDGQLLLEMEAQFADFLGVKHCIAVANATIGLQLVAHSLKLKGEVIMPSFTFIGTARAMEWQGLKPKFVDVLDSCHSLDPEMVRRAINPNVSAIMGVHLWGMPCQIDELQAIADEHGIDLIFDAAHAIGSTYKGRKIGGFGRAEVFSLHATKAINALEGGLITTNEDELAHSLRLARNYGIVTEDVYEGTGINAKMNEYSAAMALSNMEGYEKLREHNQIIQAAYSKGLEEANGIRSVTATNSEEHNSHYAAFRVLPENGLTREEIRSILIEENIYSRRYFWPGCHQIPPYTDTAVGNSLPVTENLAHELFQLPTGLQMTEDDAFAIAELISFISTQARRNSDVQNQLKKRFPS